MMGKKKKKNKKTGKDMHSSLSTDMGGSNSAASNKAEMMKNQKMHEAKSNSITSGKDPHYAMDSQKKKMATKKKM